MCFLLRKNQLQKELRAVTILTMNGSDPPLFRKITLNGTTGGLSVAKDWMKALSSARILTEKAGYLFKASLDEDHLMLAVAPCLINGGRSWHYNMRLEQENALTFLGDVNAQGVFTILFKPDSMEQLAAQTDEYLRRFRSFARFFADAGYRGKGELDEVTQGVLLQLGLNPPPQTLAELTRIMPGSAAAT